MSINCLIVLGFINVLCLTVRCSCTGGAKARCQSACKVSARHGIMMKYVPIESNWVIPNATSSWSINIIN